MAKRPRKPCREPGCRELTDGGYCEKHQKQNIRHLDLLRGNAAHRGYDARWRKARELWLKEHPLCEECKQHGKIVQATVVDHVRPHRGDQKLFWDQNNWQSLCRHCHDKKSGEARVWG
jgi:5-methylcytosine-specific restriction enzyme A